MDLKLRAKKLKSDIPAVFIALKKKETPIMAKVFAGIAIGYALSPIDLIPDFIPVIGLLDDLIIVPILIAITIKLIPEETFQQCRVVLAFSFNKIGITKIHTHHHVDNPASGKVMQKSGMHYLETKYKEIPDCAQISGDYCFCEITLGDWIRAK